MGAFQTTALTIPSSSVHTWVLGGPALLATHPLPHAQFSNHTGFPTWSGEIMDGEQLWHLVEGLEANGLCMHYTHLLTGEHGSGRSAGLGWESTPSGAGLGDAAGPA